MLYHTLSNARHVSPSRDMSFSQQKKKKYGSKPKLLVSFFLKKVTPPNVVSLYAIAVNSAIVNLQTYRVFPLA